MARADRRSSHRPRSGPRLSRPLKGDELHFHDGRESSGFVSLVAELVARHGCLYVQHRDGRCQALFAKQPDTLARWDALAAKCRGVAAQAGIEAGPDAAPAEILRQFLGSVCRAHGIALVVSLRAECPDEQLLAEIAAAGREASGRDAPVEDADRTVLVGVEQGELASLPGFDPTFSGPGFGSAQ